MYIIVLLIVYNLKFGIFFIYIIICVLSMHPFTQDHANETSKLSLYLRKWLICRIFIFVPPK